MTLAENALARVARHPLDPLTPDEITRTTQILREPGRMTSRMRLMAYSLREPAKAFVLAFQMGQPLAREVEVVIRDHERRLTVEALVSLTDGALREWRERTDVQPALTYPEVFAAQEAILAAPAFQAALARRGISDLSTVVLYPWTTGYPREGEGAAQGRLLPMEVALALHPLDNYYAHPVEGIVATVEMDTLTVRIEDHGVVPVPARSGNYSAEGIRDVTNFPSFPAGPRTDLKPIAITQPRGSASRSRGGRCAGRSGRCALVLPRVRGWCCICWISGPGAQAAHVLSRRALRDVCALRRSHPIAQL